MTNMSKPTLSRANKKRWNELSKQLRTERPICEYCKLKPSADCHHIISKYYAKSLFRYDIKDIICLCKGCHIAVWHKDPVTTMVWLKNNKYNEWQYLQDTLNQIRMY